MTRLVPPIALLLACAGLVPACAQGPGDARVEPEGIGTVEAPLSAAGPDGAMYALPSTATLTLAQQGGPSTTLALSATSASQRFSVPAGRYAATLSQGVADAGAVWTLTRAADGGSTSATAVLLDAMPVSLEVAAGGVTPLVFHFAIDSLGDVTFGTGTVGTGIAVDAGAFPLSTGMVTGTARMTTESLHGSSAFDAALAFSGTASVPYALSLTRTGGWVFAADQACAAVGATASSTATNKGLAALVDEISGASGTLCFGDASIAGQLSLHLSRTGLPRTSTMKSVLPGGGTFELVLAGYAPQVFSGTQLSLSALPEPFSVTNVAVSEVVSASGKVLADIGSAPSASASVKLSP